MSADEDHPPSPERAATSGAEPDSGDRPGHTRAGLDQSAQFDKHAAEYRQQHIASTSMVGEPVEFFAEYKIALLADEWRRSGQVPETILDFGAGIGNSLEPMHTSFPDADIIALDVSQACLEQIEALAIPRVKALAYNGRTLPLPDASVDCVFTACVFHHIPEEEHAGLLREIRRILKPDGRFILFEHNPLNPLTRLAVARCPFDEDAVLIGGPEMRKRLTAAKFKDVSLRYCLFFPRALSGLRPLERYLGWLPAGAQFFLSAR